MYDVRCTALKFWHIGQWYATHARHHGSRKAIIDASPWSLAFCKRPTGSGYAGTPVGDVYDALILPKDRCDTMIYADGLLLSLWFSCRSPSLHASLNERNPSLMVFFNGRREKTIYTDIFITIYALRCQILSCLQWISSWCITDPCSHTCYELTRIGLYLGTVLKG